MASICFRNLLKTVCFDCEMILFWQNLRKAVCFELHDKLHGIKEKLTGYTIYHNNQTINSSNLDIQRCRNCKTETLKPIEDTNELCCQNCGRLEKVEGANTH